MKPRLFIPWYQSTRNKFFPDRKGGARTTLLFLLGLFVCIVLYAGTYKSLSYFHSQNELGIILSLKIFQMIWIMLFAMLIFSCMVTTVSTFYLSEDNEILLGAPILPKELLQIRFFTTTVSTSWMVIVFSIPVFTAYAWVFQAGPLFMPLVFFSLPAVALIGSATSVLFTIGLVYLFPARRTKDIVLYLSLCFGLFLYLLFRLMRPEDLVNPDQYGKFIEYFSAISSPAGPWIPAGWAANMLTDYLLEREIDWLLVMLLLTTPAVLYFAAEIVMDKLFLTGYSKSQESFGGHRTFKVRRKGAGRLFWFFNKELRQFSRDSSEWSQLFMIAALVIVYLYNFKALPLDRSPFPTIYISNLIAFANIGLAGFLSASLATRFVFPSIGAEKGAFYLICSSPVSLSRWLWYKFLFYFVPFTSLTLILIIASNNLLQISGPVHWISIALSLIITWTVLGMGLGFGALFADFKSESKVAALGPGPILYLLVAVLYQFFVIGLGIIPTYRLVRASISGYALPISDQIILYIWAVGAIFFSLFVTLLICRLGIKNLR